MKTKQIILSIVLIFSLTFSAHAQFWKKIIDKAENKIEREAENRTQRRIDKKIDEAFDKTEEKIDNTGNQKKSNSENKEINSQNEINSEEMMEAILGDNEEAKTENSYTFHVTATMQVTNFSKSKQEISTMEQSYGKEAIMSALEEPKNWIINDLKNQTAIIIDPTQNTARIMSMAWMKKMMEQTPTQEETNDKVNFYKTGATKKLNGYTCYQYIIEDEDTKVDAWFAPDVKFNYQDYLSGFNKMFGNKKNNTVSLLNKGNGYMMEMTTFQKGKKQSHVLITSLSETPKTIKLSDYKIEKMF